MRSEDTEIIEEGTNIGRLVAMIEGAVKKRVTVFCLFHKNRDKNRLLVGRIET